MSDEMSSAEPIILRTGDGAWYALPADELERVRITDPDQLAEVRGHLAADRADTPATFLSGEVLAAHRLSDEQTAALEAAVAADTAGFGEPKSSRDVYGVFWGDHNTAYVLHSTGTEGSQAVRLVSIYRVPLNLVAQRAVIARGPGYGR